MTGGYASGLSVAVTLDNGSDTGSGVDAASRTVQRDETPLDNSDGTCDPFPGSWSTVTLSAGNDTTLTTGTCYRYRLSISDRVGNQDASSASATVKADATDPTGSVTAPAAGVNVRGATVTVAADAADTGAGVASVRFQSSPADAGTWTDVDTDAGATPWSVTWDTTALADGLYDLRVRMTDGVGRVATSALVEDVRVDNATADHRDFPSRRAILQRAALGRRLCGRRPLRVAADGGSGVDAVELSIRRARATTGTAPRSRAPRSSSVPADRHDSLELRARGADASPGRRVHGAGACDDAAGNVGPASSSDVHGRHRGARDDDRLAAPPTRRA